MYMVEIDYAEMVMRIDIELRKKGLKRTALEGEGVAASSLSNWVKGRVPSSLAVARIAHFLGVSIEWLLFGESKEGELTRDELDLVEAYRQLSLQSRAVVLTAAKGLRQD